MIVKRFAAAIVFLVVASSGTVVAASPASADSGVCNLDSSACVEFQSYGEIWTVHDYKSNGRSTLVIVDLYRDGFWDEKHWNTLGYDAPPATFNREYAEGTSLSYMTCEGYSSTGELVNCSNWRSDVA